LQNTKKTFLAEKHDLTIFWYVGLIYFEIDLKIDKIISIYQEL